MGACRISYCAAWPWCGGFYVYRVHHVNGAKPIPYAMHRQSHCGIGFDSGKFSGIWKTEKSWKLSTTQKTAFLRKNKKTIVFRMFLSKIHQLRSQIC